MNAVQRAGVGVAVLVLVVVAFFTPRLLTSSHSQVTQAAVAGDRMPVADSREAREPGDEDSDEHAADGFVDLYGNEVTDAIATYTFDQAGSLYELHSPRTELPRLAAPKS